MIDYPYQYLPPLSEVKRAELKASIQELGLLVPIEKDEHGNILDGHHRKEICEELGIKDYPITIRILGDDEAAKIGYTIAINETRRAPDENNRRFAAVKLRAEGKSFREIAEIVGVSHVAVIKWLSGGNSVTTCEEEPERITGMDGKSYAASRPKTITALNSREEEKAKEALSLTGWEKGDGETQTASSLIQEGKATAREMMHNTKREQALPSGQFQVIYADPPWQYDNSGFNEAAAGQYPTMAVEDICALPVQSLTADTSVLFLWATNPLLEEGLKVLKAWGFSYKTNIAWVKDAGRGKGWFLKSKHELLLIGVKENTPHPAQRFDSAFEAERGPVHSRKPQLAYEMIEAMYPGAKVELFCRQPRDGWEAWGNEGAGVIDMETGEIIEVAK